MRDEAPTDKDTSCVGNDCGSGERNRFFRGKVMGKEEFEKEQLYSISRRRLVSRAVLGWGVVRGFPIEGSRRGHDPKAVAPPRPFEVGPGFALDRHGRELVLEKAATLDGRNTFLLEPVAGGCRVKALDGVQPGRHLLSVHYAERRFGDAGLPEACGCGLPEKKFVCETVVFSLRPLGEERCPCAEGKCERPCRCGKGEPCCPGGRGPHECLCQWVAALPVPGRPAALCEWKGHWIDPADGVPLACLQVLRGDEKCDPAVTGWVEDDCGPRRLVKGNDILYDLLRGCDLTRIAWISWERWHRASDPIPWGDFAGYFHPDGSTEFVVRFSGPVLVDTLRLDTVVLSAITVEQPTGWRVTRRIPVTKMDTTPDPGGPAACPPDTTNQVQLFVAKGWVRDEIEPSRQSWLTDREFGIEIEIRGDLILDCHGQAVDANAVGLAPFPSGNGTPGGTFLSAFRVCPKPAGPSADVA